jgi:hypothetical protein
MRELLRTGSPVENGAAIPLVASSDKHAGLTHLTSASDAMDELAPRQGA